MSDNSKSEVSDASLNVVGGQRRRGRPPANPSTNVLTRLPNHYYDRLTQIAHRNGISMSAVVRQIVILRLKDL